MASSVPSPTHSTASVLVPRLKRLASEMDEVASLLEVAAGAEVRPPPTPFSCSLFSSPKTDNLLAQAPAAPASPAPAPASPAPASVSPDPAPAPASASPAPASRAPAPPASASAPPAPASPVLSHTSSVAAAPVSFIQNTGFTWHEDAPAPKRARVCIVLLLLVDPSPFLCALNPLSRPSQAEHFMDLSACNGTEENRYSGDCTASLYDFDGDEHEHWVVQEGYASPSSQVCLWSLCFFAVHELTAAA